MLSERRKNKGEKVIQSYKVQVDKTNLGNRSQESSFPCLRVSEKRHENSLGTGYFLFLETGTGYTCMIIL
jgi:hypothetical protein